MIPGDGLNKQKFVRWKRGIIRQATSCLTDKYPLILRINSSSVMKGSSSLRGPKIRFYSMAAKRKKKESLMNLFFCGLMPLIEMKSGGNDINLGVSIWLHNFVISLLWSD